MNSTLQHTAQNMNNEHRQNGDNESALNSLYSPEITKSMDITESQKHSLMLGHFEFIGSKDALFAREEFCGACGLLHGRIALLDIYSTCKSCHSVLREPSSLRKRFEYIKQLEHLEILIATYGHFSDPTHGNTCSFHLKKY